jgi:crotonobetaine/carnitine-CoA ligase
VSASPHATPGAGPVVEPGTVSDLVRLRAAVAPDRPVLTFDYDSLTYAEWDARADVLAGRLVELGVTPGDRVGVVLDTSPDAAVAWVAVARLGAVEVPVSPALRGESMAHPLRTAGVRLVVSSGRFLSTTSAAVEMLAPSVRLALVDDTFAPGSAGGAHGLLAHVPAAALEPQESDPDGPSVVLFSSGTTGPPKGVVLSHAANLVLAGDVAGLMGYDESDVLYNAFPLSHVNARFTTVLAAVMADASVVLHRRLSVSEFWPTCRRHGITAFNYMGTVSVLLLKQPAASSDRDHPVRRAYGSGMVGPLRREFEHRFSVDTVETYGSTELGMVTHTGFGGAPDDSCGRVVDGYEIAVQDARGASLAPGELGEIVVRPTTPQRTFREYIGNPAATVEAWRDLWFHTGDRGRIDEAGWLTFVDRTKDAIRRRGENISSWEVEQAVGRHPAVVDVCAVGVPSRISGEEVLVAVAVRQDVSPEALLLTAEAHLPHYAVPRYVRFVEQLPKTQSARTEKYKLRAEGVTDDTWDREAVGWVPRR